MNNQVKRLFTELENWKKSPIPNVTLDALKDDLSRWQAVFTGPTQTPFEGGIFKLQIDIPREYPFKPPKVGFLTRIFHPNVYTNGAICLDILTADKWSPVYSLAAVVQSIQSLLNDPNADSPANPEAGRLYRDNLPEYEKRVKLFVKQHASSL